MSNVVFIDRPVTTPSSSPTQSTTQLDNIEDILDNVEDQVDNFVEVSDDTTKIEIPIEDGIGNPVIIVVEENSETGSTTISVPNQTDVTFNQDGNETTISIPGQGDITLITDDPSDGFDLVITPEQIKNADNVKCSVKSQNKGSCEFNNFVSVVGDKVLLSDKLSVDYEKDQNTQILDARANNLIIKDKNHQTKIGGDQTTLGNTSISLSFVDHSDDLIPNPNAKTLINSERTTLSFVSSNFKHEIEKDGAYKSQLEVKNRKGISGTISLQGTQSLLAIDTQDGVKYDSNPHGTNQGVKIDTNTPLSFRYAIDTDVNNPQSTMEIGVAQMNQNGETSRIQFTEYNLDGSKTDIVANGQTMIRVNQDNKSEREIKIDKNIPARVDIISDHIQITDRDSSNNVINETSLKGLRANANIDRKNQSTDVAATLDEIKFTDKDKNQLEATGNINALYSDNNLGTSISATTDYARYKNHKHEFTVSNGLFYSETQNKVSQGPDSIRTSRFLSGGLGEINSLSDNSNIVLNGPFNALEVREFDGDKTTIVNASSGSAIKDNYALVFDENIALSFQKAKEGNESLDIYSGTLKLSDTQKNNQLALSNSQTTASRYQINGKEIIKFNTKNDEVKAKIGKNDSSILMKDMLANYYKEDKYQYGELSFKKGEISRGPEDVRLEGLSLSYEIDESNQGQSIKTVMTNAQKLSANNLDYSVNISIPGESNSEEKFTIIYHQNDSIESFSIFNEDGKKVNLDLLDKDGSTYKLLMKSVTYYSDNEFQTLMANELNGKMDIKKGDDEKLLNFQLAKVHGIQSLDKNQQHLKIEDGKIEVADLANDQSIESDFKYLQYHKIDGNETLIASVQSLNFKDESAKKQNFDITNTEVFLHNSSQADTSAMITSSSINFEDLNYAVDIKIKDSALKDEQFQIIFLDSGDTKYTKIYSLKEGKKVEVSAEELKKDKYNILFDSIEYLEDQDFKTAIASNIEGQASRDDTRLKFNFDNIFATESKINGETSIIADNGNLDINKENQSIQAQISSFAYQESDKLKVGMIDISSLDLSKLSDTDKQDLVIKNAQVVFSDDNSEKIVNGKIDSIHFNDANYKVSMALKDGNDSEQFDLLFYEKDGEQFYRILGEENGLPVEINIEQLDKSKYKALFDSIDYFKSDTYQQFIANNISGELVDISGSSPSVHIFDFEKAIATEDNKSNSRSLLIRNGSLSSTSENNSQLIFDSFDYLEDSNGKTFQLGNFHGSTTELNGGNEMKRNFEATKATGFDSQLESFLKLENLQVTESGDDQKIKAQAKEVTYSQREIQEGDYIKVENLAALAGKINYQEYKLGEKSLSADIEFGSLMAQTLTDKDNKDITVFDAEDISFSAIDITEDIKLQAKTERLSLFNNEQIQTVEIKDLQDFSFNDFKNMTTVKSDADRILRVVQKDDTGNPIKEYLLLDNTILGITDDKNKVSADIRIQALEILQDKLKDQDIILRADLQGRAKLNEGVGAELNFALKGEKMVLENESYTSDDGSFSKHEIGINTTQGGKIENLSLTAGPSFLKDFISIKAKGGDNGRAVRFSVMQDKKAGTLYLRSEFKDGDKVKIKFLPFELESKKQGKDAIAELLVTPKGQNHINHLEIISSVADMEEVTKWLQVNADTIALRGDLSNKTALEIFYSKEDLWNNPFNLEDPYEIRKAATYGFALVKKQDSGAENSYGVMLSGDSEIAYNTNGNGVLKIAGIKMDRAGSIPGTLNMFFRRKTDDSTHMLNLGYSTTKHLVDFDHLSKDAPFHEGGMRSKGGGSLSYSYSKDLSSSSKISIGVGAYNDFTEPAVNICYEKRYTSRLSFYRCKAYRWHYCENAIYLR